MWGFVTVLLWLLTIILIEVNYRVGNNSILSLLSPLQWFVVLLFLWGTISIFNVLVYLDKSDSLEIHIVSIQFLDTLFLVLCFIPITNIIILFGNLYYLLKNLLQPYEKEISEHDKFIESLSDTKE